MLLSSSRISCRPPTRGTEVERNPTLATILLRKADGLSIDHRAGLTLRVTPGVTSRLLQLDHVTPEVTQLRCGGGCGNDCGDTPSDCPHESEQGKMARADWLRCAHSCNIESKETGSQRLQQPCWSQVMRQSPEIASTCGVYMPSRLPRWRNARGRIPGSLGRRAARARGR